MSGEAKEGQQVPDEKRLKRHNEHMQLCKQWLDSRMGKIQNGKFIRNYWMIVNCLRYYRYIGEYLHL